MFLNSTPEEIGFRYLSISVFSIKKKLAEFLTRSHKLRDFAKGKIQPSPSSAFPIRGPRTKKDQDFSCIRNPSPDAQFENRNLKRDLSEHFEIPNFQCIGKLKKRDEWLKAKGCGYYLDIKCLYTQTRTHTH